MGTFNSGKRDAALLPEARLNAMKLMKSMLQYKPFSYIRREHFLKFPHTACIPGEQFFLCIRHGSLKFFFVSVD